MSMIHIPDMLIQNLSSSFVEGTVNGEIISLDIGDTVLIMFARQIIKEELDYVEKNYPNVDLERIQEMLMGDYEMKQLGYLALKEYTMYTVPLLQELEMYNISSLQNLIIEYSHYCSSNVLLRPPSLWKKKNRD